MTLNYDKVEANYDKVRVEAYAANTHKEPTVKWNEEKAEQTMTKFRFCHSLWQNAAYKKYE